MIGINVYLNFNGNCREAMTFYAKCLGGELLLMTFADMPGETPKELKDKIMHAKVSKGSHVLMASDADPRTPLQPGNNFSICIQCESLEEIERLYSALGEKGTLTSPLQDTFWGARFGLLTDQFGIQWMFNFDTPKHA
jgi:PhnB protein